MAPMMVGSTVPNVVESSLKSASNGRPASDHDHRGRRLTELPQSASPGLCEPEKLETVVTGSLPNRSERR
jgi:hypothetical protein